MKDDLLSGSCGHQCEIGLVAECGIECWMQRGCVCRPKLEVILQGIGRASVVAGNGGAAAVAGSPHGYRKPAFAMVDVAIPEDNARHRYRHRDGKS